MQTIIKTDKDTVMINESGREELIETKVDTDKSLIKCIGKWLINQYKEFFELLLEIFLELAHAIFLDHIPGWTLAIIFIVIINIIG